MSKLHRMIVGKAKRQGDQISAYLFILVLEIVFLSIDKNKNIRGFDICNHTFSYTSYADDSTFSLNEELSVTEMMKLFDEFSLFFGVRPNKSKREVARIGVLKGVEVALSEMESINLTSESVKILRIQFSCNKQIESEENFLKKIVKIESVLKFWRMSNVTVKVK